MPLTTPGARTKLPLRDFLNPNQLAAARPDTAILALSFVLYFGNQRTCGLNYEEYRAGGATSAISCFFD